jgi:hypothetical protein
MDIMRLEHELFYNEIMVNHVIAAHKNRFYPIIWLNWLSFAPTRKQYCVFSLEAGCMEVQNL